MKYTKEQKWERFRKYNFEFPSIGLAANMSRMGVDDAFFDKLEPQLPKAHASMTALEVGAIANPDENRMVGHYWLRKAEVAPTPEIRQEIQDNLVISRSGGNKETRNGILIAQHAYETSGLDFGKHAVAITMKESDLNKLAKTDNWVKRFSMSDWFGGRISKLSVVGLLPAALQGFEINQMLEGAAAREELTRSTETKKNPAALLASAWFLYGNDKVYKKKIFFPYKDRLKLFYKYLQHLVMESLGKALHLDEKLVNEGITVVGKATNQNSYIQQLRDGLNDFFAGFLEALKEVSGKIIFLTVGEIGKLTGINEYEWIYKIYFNRSANQRSIAQNRDFGQVKFGLA